MALCRGGCLKDRNGQPGLCDECRAKKPRGHEGPRNYVEGDRKVSKDGYAYIYQNGRWYPEHRFVMELMIERKLVQGESVHHKNGVRDDNRPDNLELWVKPPRPGIRAKDALVWAKEFIDRYEGLDL